METKVIFLMSLIIVYATGNMELYMDILLIMAIKLLNLLTQQ